MLTMDHAVLPATHTFIDKSNEPYLPLLPMQPQSVTALWPVLIFHPDEGRRLSWFEWLVTNQGGYPPTDGHPSQYSLIQTDVLPLSQAATWIVNMNKWPNDITGRPLSSTAKFSDISPTVRVTPTHIVFTHCQVQCHLSLPVHYKHLLIFYKNVHYDSISSNILKTGNMRRPAIVY